MAAELLRLESLSKFYTGKQSVVVGLDKLNLSFRRGEFVAITGESGSGKSTLSHVLGGILPFESGEMYFGGKPTSHFDGVDWERYRRDQISFISQNYGILPGATVLGNVVSALRLTGMNKQEAVEAAQEILKQVELWDFRRRRAAKLSSGQKQRLSIARALAKPAPILIADEPTGNLDPENSIKVMELLAQAAKERLVILVTHEFPEAEPYATRHIVLQDGRVIMDAPLREAAEPAPLPQRRKDGTKLLSFYVAALQQRSRPVWTSLMIAFFAITAFSVFAFMGNFIVALDDTATRKYDDRAFANGSPTRIIVSTSDNQPMTEADYEAILGANQVIALERNGYVTDVQYAYRENKDFKLLFENLQYDLFGQPVGDGHQKDTDDDGVIQKIVIDANAPFLCTIPMLKNEEFLTAGRLPDSIFEAVAVARPDQIGRYATVHLSAPNSWGRGQIITVLVQIVGTTDYGSGLYFHEDLGRVCQQSIRMDKNKMVYVYMPNAELDDKTFLCNADLLEHFRISGMYTMEDGSITASFRSPEMAESDDPDVGIRLSLPQLPKNDPINYSETLEKSMQVNSHQSAYVMEVSPANFDKLTWSQNSEQVSATIADYAYTDRVCDQLQAMGYIAFSPYQLSSTEVIEEKALERDQTLKICLAALVAILLLQVILLRAMFANQMGDYKLLSNIGLTCASAMRSILVQLVILTVVGQVLAGTALWICAVEGVEVIRNIMVYLPLNYVALLVAVHDVVSLIGITWVLIALKKQVYPLAGKESDLAMEETEVEAV